MSAKRLLMMNQKIPVQDATATLLAEKTEGWVAGLRLAALAKANGIYCSRLIAAPCFVHMMSGDLKQAESAAIQLSGVSEKADFPMRKARATTCRPAVTFTPVTWTRRSNIFWNKR